MRRIEIYTTIRNGLPVLVSGNWVRAEPDVGIFDHWIEDIDICWRSGQGVPLSMRISKADIERITEELIKAHDEQVEDTRF